MNRKFLFLAPFFYILLRYKCLYSQFAIWQHWICTWKYCFYAEVSDKIIHFFTTSVCLLLKSTPSVDGLTCWSGVLQHDGSANQSDHVLAFVMAGLYTVFITQASVVWSSDDSDGWAVMLCSSGCLVAGSSGRFSLQLIWPEAVARRLSLSLSVTSAARWARVCDSSAQAQGWIFISSAPLPGCDRNLSW